MAERRGSVRLGGRSRERHYGDTAVLQALAPLPDRAGEPVDVEHRNRGVAALFDQSIEVVDRRRGPNRVIHLAQEPREEVEVSLVPGEG